MKVIVVDDEQIILQTEKAMIENILKDAEVEAFFGVEEAMNYANNHEIDIAFLDINMEMDNGLELAKRLQEQYPRVNIIFCTGYSEYSLDALELYCSAYLMKPITEEKLEKALDRLRYPISDKNKNLYVRCFGNFEVLFDGKPVKFKYGKTKEMFAYMIDRNGAMLNLKEIMSVLFDDDGKESYMRNIKADLINTFQMMGIDNVLVQDWGKIGVNPEKINCDYYDYLKGNKSSFHGEYMTQYSFSEMTLMELKS